MKLKVRKGWVEDDDGACVLLYPSGGNYLGAYAAVVPWGMGVEPWVAAYPHGVTKHTEKRAFGGKTFRTIEEAHAYLLRMGSESPWEENNTKLY
jgi:hypothetical protein